MKYILFTAYLFKLGIIPLPAQVGTGSSSDSLKKEVEILLAQRNFMAAKKLAGIAYQSSVDKTNFPEIAQCLYLLTRVHALSGDFKQAIEYGEKGSAVSEILNRDTLEYNINNLLSWAYFEVGKPLDFRLNHQKKQMNRVTKLAYPAATALVENNYSYDLTVSGTIHLDSAIELMINANDFYAREENHKGRWYTLMNLCWQYRLRNELDSSKHYGKLSAEQAVIIDDRHAMIESFAHLGETLLAKNDLEQVVNYYNKALKRAEEKEDRDRYVFHVYYARFLWLTGADSDAINLLKDAITFLEQDEIFYEMMGRALLANIYQKQNQYDLALEQVRKIEHPRSDYISFETKFRAALVKAEILRAWKKYQQAANHIKPFLSKAEEIGAAYLVKLAQKNPTN